MACYDESPYTCTYDSNAGAGKDYSTLSTWEGESDNDLSGTGITMLDCYDSQVHDDFVGVGGSTNEDPTHYRGMRSASDCATPFAGKAGTGANFVYTGSAYNYTFYGLSTESYFQWRQLCAKYNGNNANGASTFYMYGEYQKAIHCVSFDSVNNHGVAAMHTGFFLNGQHGQLAFGCISYNTVGGNGIHLTTLAGDVSGIVCCTCINNDLDGFSATTSGTSLLWGCYGADNTSEDFEAGKGFSGGWCASKDATASGIDGTNYKNSIDLLASGALDSDYLAVAGETLSWAAGAGENAGRNPYDDLTATSDFDDFLKNDTAGDDLYGKGIEGNTRDSVDADAQWAVGASVAATPSASAVQSFVQAIES